MKTSAPAFTFPVLDIPFGVNNKYFNQPSFFLENPPDWIFTLVTEQNGIG